MSSHRVFTSSQVCLPEGPSPATIEVKDGKITAVHREVLPRSRFAGADYVDAGDQWLLPGLVDCHVHLNEPGRTEWEGFATGTAVSREGSRCASFPSLLKHPKNDPNAFLANSH